ncbi:MAG TPA: hypothetical protein VFV33_26340 [Gemmatimonadaceae bacterium]|nr:hypothetical protein [Gemmatimonadaceae bacterium]
MPLSLESPPSSAAPGGRRQKRARRRTIGPLANLKPANDALWTKEVRLQHLLDHPTDGDQVQGLLG